MSITRKIIEVGLSIRAENGIKVRQPLENLQFTIHNLRLEENLAGLIKDEVNVKKIEIMEKIKANNDTKIKEDDNIKVALNIEITPELKLEGQMRELIRHIQQARKEADFQVDDRIKVWHKGGNDIINAFKEIITKEVLATEIKEYDGSAEADYNKKVKVDGEEIEIWVEKSF